MLAAAGVPALVPFLCDFLCLGVVVPSALAFCRFELEEPGSFKNDTDIFV